MALFIVNGYLRSNTDEEVSFQRAEKAQIVFRLHTVFTKLSDSLLEGLHNARVYFCQYRQDLFGHRRIKLVSQRTQSWCTLSPKCDLCQGTGGLRKNNTSSRLILFECEIKIIVFELPSCIWALWMSKHITMKSTLFWKERQTKKNNRAPVAFCVAVPLLQW